MNNLTPTERRRLRESIQSDDPMMIAEAEDAMASAQAEIDRPRVYLTAGFKRSTAETLHWWAERFNWREESFAASGCPDPYAHVLNGADVTLRGQDQVLIDSFWRINAFRQGGAAYLIAES